MVVGVPHGPARRMSFSLLRVRPVDKSAVPVCPFGEGVVFADSGHRTVVYVPVHGRGGARVGDHPATHARGCWTVTKKINENTIDELIFIDLLLLVIS